MKLSRTLAAVATLALTALVVAAMALAPAAAADAPVPRGKHLLRYNFALGDVLRYRVSNATNLRTTIDGTTQTVKTQSDSVKVWKVTDVLPSGEIEFVHLVESVKMTNEMPGQPTRSYDSTSGEPPAPGFESAARAVGVPLVVVRMTPEGKITKREDKVAQTAKPTEDAPITLELPDQPVAIGEKWSHTYDIVVKKHGGADMQIRTRRVCQLKQVKAGVAVIGVEYQILTPVDAFIRSQLVERLTKGTVRFDVQRGRVVQQLHEVDRREIGFAGQQSASSMHFVARTQERLMTEAAKDAAGIAAVKPASATK
jgi:hypothetical protein